MVSLSAQNLVSCFCLHKPTGKGLRLVGLTKSRFIGLVTPRLAHAHSWGDAIWVEGFFRGFVDKNVSK